MELKSRFGGFLDSAVRTRVSDLIDPTSGYWDEHPDIQTFWHMDAQRILAIPLPLNEMKDFVAWNLTKARFFQ